MSSPKKTALDEANELSQMLVDITERAKNDFAAIAGDLGLTVPLARAVTLLDEPRAQRDLAELLACDRSYVTSIADQLEERGLVERVAGSDRRIKLLRLTHGGSRVRADLAAAVQQRALVLRKLTAQERAALRPLLVSLLREN